MKKFIKILSILLAFLMLASTLVACGGTDDEKGDSTASTQGGEAAGAGLPALNWEGTEYRILGRGTVESAQNSEEWASNFEIWRESLPADVVGKAVYERNQALREKYGITVVGTFANTPANSAKTMLEAGEDLYDLLVMAPEAHHPLAASGYLLDMYSLDYVDTDANGWQAYANKQLTMGGKLYYTTNKFLIQDKNRTWAMFYNRNMAKELNLGHFEDYVFDGSWTIDKLIELGKQATADSDGNVGMTLEDRWGVGASSAYTFCQFAYGVGFRFTDHGNDGYPVLVGATDRIIQQLDKVYSLTTNGEAFYCDGHYGSVDYNDCIDQRFIQGNVLSIAIPISAIGDMTAQSDFTIGILPNPKYDESQDDYYAIPNLGNGSLLSVPATVMDTSFAGFALEAITEASPDTSYTAYIETKCKLQDAYDEDAAKCFDIIFNGVVYDIAFTSNISGLGDMLGDQMAVAKTNTYARLYKALSKIATKEIENIKTSYAAID